MRARLEKLLLVVSTNTNMSLFVIFLFFFFIRSVSVTRIALGTIVSVLGSKLSRVILAIRRDHFRRSGSGFVRNIEAVPHDLARPSLLSSKTRLSYSFNFSSYPYSSAFLWPVFCKEKYKQTKRVTYIVRLFFKYFVIFLKSLGKYKSSVVCHYQWGLSCRLCHVPESTGMFVNKGKSSPAISHPDIVVHHHFSFSKLQSNRAFRYRRQLCVVMNSGSDITARRNRWGELRRIGIYI